MDFLLEKFSEFIKGIIIDSIGNNFGGMLEKANESTNFLAGEIIVSPSAYSPPIWAMIQNVSEVVIVPVAAMILTAVMCIELISWAGEKNNFKDSNDVIKMFIMFVVKLMIGVTLVSKAHEITVGIFDVTAYLVNGSAGVVTGGGFSTAISVEQLKETLMDKDLGYIISMWFLSLVGNIGIIGMTIVIEIILIGRMIEIYLYCSMGSIPYATLMNKEIGGIGQNYIKNLFALAFQGFFIFLMVGIYAVLTKMSPCQPTQWKLYAQC